MEERLWGTKNDVLGLVTEDEGRYYIGYEDLKTFTFHLLTTLTLHHTFTVSFQAQNSPVPQIFSTIVC